MNKGSRWYGNTLLTITAIIWGLAFVAQSAGMKYVGPFTFQCVQCVRGANGLVGFPVMARRLPEEGAGRGRGGRVGGRNGAATKSPVRC